MSKPADLQGPNDAGRRVSTYFDEIHTAMQMIGEHPQAIFLGQAVAEKGPGMTASFDGVPREKLLELPVFEETQLGMSIGLALDGWLPVSVFPRWNFLLAATNQLVNHLDKFPQFARVKPRVIIRTASATPFPLNPGAQHLGDFTSAFRIMLDWVEIIRLENGRRIVHEYERAMKSDRSTILVEYPARYADAF